MRTVGVLQCFDAVFGMRFLRLACGGKADVLKVG